MNRDNFALIDKPTFFGALFLLLLVVIPLAIWPEQGAMIVARAKALMTTNLGAIYLIMGLGSLFFMIYIIFSEMGQIKLGDADEEPEFGTASWAAMLFCGGIGASILYWGCIEWAYYYQSPPFQLEPGSEEAIRWAATYGIFHWGFIAWAIYLVPALPIAYFFYVRKQPVLKVSAALMPVIGEKRSQGWLGKVVDVLFIFGLLGGGATTLGLASPLISEGLNQLFGLPQNIVTQIGVLLVCTLIFGYSAYAGLEKGIKMLSNFNFWGAIALLAFVFVAGPTVFMLETGLDAFGRMLSNFFVMATWAEPFGGTGPFRDTHFPQDWTVFYWAWWLVFAPSMGLFVARISRGRTIKQMVAGAMFFGSMGCFLFFMILGNYGLSLQLTGELDVVAVLNAEGATPAIFAILNTLPMPTLVVAVFTLLALVFTATTFDSISYILASVVQNNVTDEPMRWNRLFWAFALSFMPTVLMVLGGLATLQTAAIVAGAPLLVIAFMLGLSGLRAAQLDLQHQEDYEDPVITIGELPAVDPWSEEGKALGTFETLKQTAIEAAQEERDAREAILNLKAEMRMASERDPRCKRTLKAELARLQSRLATATAQKLEATEAAQTARAEFNAIVMAKREAEEAAMNAAQPAASQ